MKRADLEHLDDCRWQIPTSYRSDMRVPVHVFATESILDTLLAGETLEQAVCTATLSGIIGRVVVMPDACADRGAPIGTVVATKYPVGVITPSAIGADINAGMRLLASDIDAGDVDAWISDLADALFERIPAGTDVEGPIKLSLSDVEHVARSGSQWALRQGYATQDDLVRTEEGGRFSDADPDAVSRDAHRVGRSLLGTLSERDHYVEVDVVEEVLDPVAAQTLRLEEGTLAVQIRSGSGRYGRAIHEDYEERFRATSDADASANGFLTAPLDTPEATSYIDALHCAANLAYANRQVLTHAVREVLDDLLGEDRGAVRTVADVAHNMGRLEMHQLNGRMLRCFVHRKGSVRALGPGTPGIALPYRALGQPVLVPGGLGEASWVLVGITTGMKKSFGSVCQHVKEGPLLDGEALSLTARLQEQGIAFRSPRTGERCSENGHVPPSVDDLVQITTRARLARRVARLRPLAVLHA